MSYAGKVSANEELHLIGSTLYGTCSTAASTAAKVAALSDFDTLLTGVTVFIKFNYANTAANATLNVNNTGALPIYVSGISSVGTSAITSWEPNSIVAFTYDGAAWVMVGANKVIMDTVDCLVSDSNNHNGIYRGRNLGTITSANIGLFVTEHEIPTGKFTDLYLGDYFVIQDGTYNKEWMIAGFDVHYSKVSEVQQYSVLEHAITVIPRGAGLFKARYHSSNSTDVGEWNSELFKQQLDDESENSSAAYYVLHNILGTHIKNQFYTQTSAASSGATTSLTTGAGTSLILPNEVEYFGTDVLASDKPAMRGSMQLPVFRFVLPGRYCEGEEYWIGSLYNGTDYLCTRHGGNAQFHASATSTDNWVRPRMAIG